jgi:hypothetical protein
MGSWNDLGFEGDDQAQYDRLSDELYALLVQAAVTGANMSVAPRNPLVTGANPNVPPRKPSQAKPWWQFWK